MSPCLLDDRTIFSHISPVGVPRSVIPASPPHPGSSGRFSTCRRQFPSCFLHTAATRARGTRRVPLSTNAVDEPIFSSVRSCCPFLSVVVQSLHYRSIGRLDLEAVSFFVVVVVAHSFCCFPLRNVLSISKKTLTLRIAVCLGVCRWLLLKPCPLAPEEAARVMALVNAVGHHFCAVPVLLLR
jgi:hypothetical protein